MKNSNCYILIALLILFFTTSAFADSWALPEKRTVCSENNKYCLKVIPKKLESQLSYFEDKVDKKKNAGANKKVKDNYCKGIFYSRNAKGKLKKHWQIRLVNEVSPVNILVSNDGKYIVTLNNWHGVGYGDDVVVIYESSKGKMINKFGLSDFLTKNDISELPRSTSSIWWGGKHFINSSKQNLILQVVKKGSYYEKVAEFFPLHIDLKTGKLLDKIKDRLPHLQFLIKVYETSSKNTSTKQTEKKDSCENSQNYKTIPSYKLLSKIVTENKIKYPIAARVANIQGITHLEILINENGEVDCINDFSGHWLLKRSIKKEVKKWKFEKSAVKYKGVLAFEGKRTLVSPK